MQMLLCHRQAALRLLGAHRRLLSHNLRRCLWRSGRWLCLAVRAAAGDRKYSENRRH